MQSAGRSPSVSDQISILLETLELSGDEQTIRAALLRFTLAVGFNRYLYFSVGADGSRGLTNAAPSWYQRYIEEDFVSIDPVMVQARRTPKPFIWSHPAIQPKGTQEARFKKAVLDVGIVSGVTIPVRVGFGRTAMLAFTSDHDVVGRFKPELFKAAIAAVAYTHLHMSHIEKILDTSTGEDLSARELTCLVWTSLGKTKTEIAQMHGIAEKTVRFYLDRAREKLSATNAPHMVRRAFEKGIIPRR